MDTFLEAVNHPDEKGVEKIFAEFTEFTYIEGRDPGANFPDKELREVSDSVALSTFIAPSVIQAGLLRNLEKIVQYIDSFAWEHLRELHDVAITHGLQGEVDGVSVYEFAKKIVSLAAEKLTTQEAALLAYPEYVLKTQQNGADRAIAFVENQKGSLKDRLQKLVRQRKVVL